MRENSKYAPRATVLLVSLSDFYISLPSGLSIRDQSSFEFFVSIHLIWLSNLSWPESCQHINQLGRHRLTTVKPVLSGPRIKRTPSIKWTPA